jgi:hypothetical protein
MLTLFSVFYAQHELGRAVPALYPVVWDWFTLRASFAADLAERLLQFYFRLGESCRLTVEFGPSLV